MKYIALLRGINVGGKNKVDMKRLRTLLESMKYMNVETYLNSGNIIFETDLSREIVSESISKTLFEEFALNIRTLIKTSEEIIHIESVIPDEWQNNKDQKTDVAYLFPEIDSEKTLDEIPVNRKYTDLIYCNGAIIWHIMKKDYNKSQLNKLIGRKLYHFMTVRNVNTARYLAGLD
ncbi:MAG: DUF1697 domain-containing protein [Spirochaetales bacterium]|uniref:DUF1697 domain-containing protein n=1 Tax=Candidatus Thalassospirochaeta sargassi TaxID=3119039 RepID=A0AAJ1MIU4_9SPIO|nr:DUF1697 domain-containing protein [Spirochaetales bacterium]